MGAAVGRAGLGAWGKDKTKLPIELLYEPHETAPQHAGRTGLFPVRFTSNTGLRSLLRP